MAAPDRRELAIFRRGQVRDEIILAHYRNELRSLTNPDTGQTFTEDEIQRATAPGTRKYLDADGDDLAIMVQQQRAMFLFDQVDPRRASGRVLRDLHGELWVGAPLAAAPASGDVDATGLAGSSFPGSTTLPDAAACVGVDGNGTEYQVLQTEAIAAGQTSVRLTLKALSGGYGTNVPVGTVITWTTNKPAGADATATVVEQTGYADQGFTGGYDGENDSEYAQRITDEQADRPGAGNAAHFQKWALEANSATEQAFVYPCALNAGSVVVVPTQRRDQNALSGPTGRLPSAGLLTDLIAQLVPPASPVVPERAYVLVVTPRAQSVDLVLRIAMNRGQGGGWFNAIPWPNPTLTSPPEDTEVAAIVTVVSQTEFTVNSSYGLPGAALALSGADAPALMVWAESSSRFEPLNVASVTSLGAGVFSVLLNVAPSHVLAVGDRICPYTDRCEEIAIGLEQHFDLLGPAELVGPADARWSRAARRPLPSVRYPQKVGSSIGSAVAMVLGSVSTDVVVAYASATEPDLTGDVSEGPNMLVLGAVTVYPEG